MTTPGRNGTTRKCRYCGRLEGEKHMPECSRHPRWYGVGDGDPTVGGRGEPLVRVELSCVDEPYNACPEPAPGEYDAYLRQAVDR